MAMRAILEARRASLVAEREEITADADNFGDVEEARASEITSEVASIDERLAALADEEARDAAAAAARAAQRPPEVHEPHNPVYRKDDLSTSYFRDLADAGRGNREAIGRLAASQERANTTAATDGGEFAPPLWLVQDFIALARAGRVTADLVAHETLPNGVDSINVPKITTGTDTAVVVTEATAITQQDIVTTSVSSGITTISGGETVSIQLLRQSAIPVDRIVLEDLAMDYASTLNAQVIGGSGASGQLAGLITSGTVVTYTTTAPAVVSTTAAASFYNKVVKGQAALAASRYLPADAIVMTPNRWAWVLQALDGSTRPLVTPYAPSNAPGTGSKVGAEGPVGNLAGLPVYVDPSLPTDRGAATNQDVVFVMRRNDAILYESPMEAASFDATYAASNAVFFRVLGFAALVTRHAGSFQYLDGTGLVAPTL